MSNTERQISTLIQRIDALTLEANELTRELQTLTRRQEANDEELVEGDFVEITNNYLGQKGVTGIITKVTRTQYRIRNETTGRKYSRKKNNVRKTTRP
jgi:hypothetical protein